ncbi:MAG: prephenate dehydratase [Chloroflexota bacterium]
MSLEELRRQIDEVDTRIAELLVQRLQVAGEIGRQKQKGNQFIEDIEREQKVLEHVKDIARPHHINEDDIEKVYRQIMTISKHVQQVDVAFQGELGAHSEEAAFRFFGSPLKSHPCESFEEVFRVVAVQETQFGVVPIENSLEGSISRVYDLLLDSALMVCGEIEHRVIHCLIGSPEAGLDTIKKVYSHPQALGQSHNFLRHLNAELVPAYDTAGSVKMVQEMGRKDVAAVASARAAEIYGMKILAREIEDNPNNYTRFFILAKKDTPPTGNDKTSIVFSAKDRPGALYESLNEFATRKVNLTKLESRPTRQKPWEYNFYLDFSGHREDKPCREALAALEKTSIFVKVLGSYPKARRQG